MANEELDSLTSNYYLSYDLDNETVLISKNSDKQISPASLTKIMTAILLYEKFPLSNTHLIQFPRTYVYDGKVAYLNSGEYITTEELLELLLIYSANDAAYATALIVSESVDDFIDLMNTKATLIGMTNTTFANPDGLDNKQHLTTIDDLLLLSKYTLLKTKLFDIFSKEYSYYKNLKFDSTNALLNENFSGIKTGWTSSAGLTFIGYNTSNNRKILTIVNNSLVNEDRDNHFKDTRLLYNYSINNFKNIELLKAEDNLYNIQNYKNLTKVSLDFSLNTFGNIIYKYDFPIIELTENKFSLLFKNFDKTIDLKVHKNNKIQYIYNKKNNIFYNLFK